MPSVYKPDDDLGKNLLEIMCIILEPVSAELTNY
jgi:hypothetical protein